MDGAHLGLGLGHEFLKHIERAGILVHLVEPQPSDASDPVANYHTIRHEIASHSEELSHRPEIVVVSKSELPAAAEVRDRLAASLGREVLAISAVTGQGLNDLTWRILQQLDARAGAAAV
jgi:GTPase